MKFFDVAPRLLALLGVSLGLVACKDDGIDTGQYAEAWPAAVCDAVLVCNCDYPNGALLDHCLAQLGVGASTLAELNDVEGLSFDGVCAQKEIDAVGSLGCGVVIPDPDAQCKTPCKLWHGPMGKGATCTSINGYDNCKQGLTCGEGVCVNPCAEPDLPNVGQACAPQYGCAEGAWCDGETTPLFPVCAALPGAGVPCVESDFGFLCAEDLFCDMSEPDAPVCAALPGLGDECPDGACAEGLFCDTDEMPFVCANPPTLGEDCPLGFCEAPFLCDGGECIQPRPAVCGNYGGLPEDDGGNTTIDPTTNSASGPVDTGVDTGGLDTGGVDTGGFDTGVVDTGVETGTDLGDCCLSHDGPGCSDPAVTECVCSQDEVCCIDFWSETCAAEVDIFGCGVCG